MAHRIEALSAPGKVNDYSFEGSTVGGRSRVTMVLGKFGDEWRIVHHHVSRFEDLKKSS